MRRYIEKITKLLRVSKDLESLKVLTGRSLLEARRGRRPESLQDMEFKVFSQFGDDGIIQYLIDKCEMENKTFIEFGVENYTESNTRFLLLNNNWRGLVIDGGAENISYIKNDDISWRHDLTAELAFITRDNINEIIKKAGFAGKAGILSVDVDGNDYWIWDAITVVDPEIVILEYNSVFGKEHAVTIPYQKDFYRTKAHYSNLYWGASLRALVELSASKGFVFLGCNSSGNNAYFVKKGKLGDIKQVSVDTAFIDGRFSESRNSAGGLSYLRGSARLREISTCEIYNCGTRRNVKIQELYRL